VHAHVGDRGLKKVGDHGLRQPDGLAFEPHVQFDASVFGLVNEELGVVGFVAHGLGFEDLSEELPGEQFAGVLAPANAAGQPPCSLITSSIPAMRRMVFERAMTILC